MISMSMISMSSAINFISGGNGYGTRITRVGIGIGWRLQSFPGGSSMLGRACLTSFGGAGRFGRSRRVVHFSLSFAQLSSVRSGRSGRSVIKAGRCLTTVATTTIPTTMARTRIV